MAMGLRFEELTPEDQKDALLQLEYWKRELPVLRLRAKQLEDTLAIYANRANWNPQANFEFNTSPGWELAERVLAKEKANA